MGSRVLTAVGDDPHVGLDDLHVDAVLLLPDDDRPPQPDVLPLLLGSVRGDGIVGLAGAPPAGRAGFWRKTESDRQKYLDFFLLLWFSTKMSKCASGGAESDLPSRSRGPCSPGSPPPPACPARPRRCPGRPASPRGRPRSGPATG